MTDAIQRAKKLLARLESGTEGVYLVPVKDILAGYIGAVEALRRSTKLMALLTEQQPPEFRGEHNALDEAIEQAHKTLAEFERLFPPQRN